MFSIKHITAILPVLYLCFLSLAALFAQYKITSKVVKSGQIEKLEETAQDESDERAILKRSNELLMECVRTLETKVDTEIVTRRAQQQEAEKEREIHQKKIEW